MRDELQDSLWRYDAMTGIVDWNNPDDPGREERDLAAYGRDYGLIRYPDGQDYTCYARIVRFLTEVCGHSYEESLEALIEHVREQPSMPRTGLDAEADARAIRARGGNIVEALLSLKIGRLIAGDNPEAVEFNWRVTRTLTRLTNSTRKEYGNDR